MLKGSKMKEVIFNGGIIQTGHRVKIPKPIIDTLGMDSGDSVSIRFNVETGEIIIKREGKIVKK